MANTPRGFPYPTLASAADVPFWLQQLAEALDAQMQALDDATFKKVGFTKAPDFDVTANSTSESYLTNLDTTFPRVAGHRYRITVAFASYSTVAADVLGVNVRVAGAQIANFTDMANGSPSLTASGKWQIFTAFYDAPNSVSSTLCAIRITRAAGTGVVHATSTATSPATLLVEDMGVI